MTSLPRFSVSISSTHRDDGPRRMIERARAAHAAGFVSLTIGDHHDMAVPYAQNVPMLGRLLAEWTDRPAGCLFLVPLWQPLLMAEQIGTLAAIHQLGAPGERFIVQTGIGWGASQFVNLGADMRTRGRNIDAAIPVVKALLAGERVSDDYFGLSDAKVGLRSAGTYEWWIGGTAEVAIDRAARLGDAWYGTPGQGPDDLARAIDRFRNAGGGKVMVRRDVVVAATAEQAHQRASELIERGYRGLTLDQLLYGTPDQVAEQAEAAAALGVDELVVRCADSEQAHAIETLELLGTLT